MQPLITEAQELARDLATTKFAQRASTFDQDRRYCFENIEDMKNAGLMGMSIPTRYGGKGSKIFELVLIAEELARHCALTARVFVEANMGGIGAIMHYGDEHQKQEVAKLVLQGDKPAICITEPDAGSAATHMKTTAKRSGGGYILNGCKHWITGGGVSKTHLVFAKIIDERGRSEGIGAFILIIDHEKPADGFKVIGKERTMGLCGMPEARLEFDNVYVPYEMRLQTPSGAAGCFADLMTAYNGQRVGAGAIALGLASGALDDAKRYMLEREQFGRPIAEFQGLQWKIADMATSTHAARLMLHDAAKSTHGTLPFPDMTKAAQAKLFAAETAQKVVNEALQVFGARGYSSAEKIERMYRDVRMFTIGGGTTEILRNQIASDVLSMKTPQTRDGYMRRRSLNTFVQAAE